MEELLPGTGSGEKTLLTGLWCLFVYSGFVGWCLISTELYHFNHNPVGFLWHCRLVRRLQATVRLAFPSSPRKKCHSVPLFLSNKFLEENLDSHVEYYALKGNFLNESTNSVNYAEPCLLACVLEDGTLGPWTGQAAEQWRGGCCQFPVGFGNVNSVCMWKNTELCFLTLAMFSTAPFHRVCSGNQDQQLARTWHHACSSEPQAAKAQRLEKRAFKHNKKGHSE